MEIITSLPLVKIASQGHSRDDVQQGGGRHLHRENRPAEVFLLTIAGKKKKRTCSDENSERLLKFSRSGWRSDANNAISKALGKSYQRIRK